MNEIMQSDMLVRLLRDRHQALLRESEIERMWNQVFPAPRVDSPFALLRSFFPRLGTIHLAKGTPSRLAQSVSSDVD